MNTCKSCKWWELWPKAKGVFGECNHKDIIEADFDEKFDEMPGDGQLIARSSSAVLILTSPTFGCIHWEAKNEPT